MRFLVRQYAIVTLVAVAMCPTLLVGCSGDSPVELYNHAALFWALKSNIEATTLALGDTEQLHAVPQDPTGDSLAGYPAPTFRSADTAHVKVTPDGLVTAVDLTAGVAVVASLTVKGITNVDTTIVAVTPSSAVLQTLLIDTTGPFVLDKGSTKFLTPIVKDDHGNALSGLSIKYRSLDPLVATVQSQYSSVVVTANAVGTARITAATTSYGITRVDTVTYTVRYPTTITLNCSSSSFQPFFPASPVIIGVNGSVTFRNSTPTPMNITFTSGISDIPGGQITGLAPFASVTRQFPRAGAYNLTTSPGYSATIIVVQQ